MKHSHRSFDVSFMPVKNASREVTEVTNEAFTQVYSVDVFFQILKNVLCEVCRVTNVGPR